MPHGQKEPGCGVQTKEIGAGNINQKTKNLHWALGNPMEALNRRLQEDLFHMAYSADEVWLEYRRNSANYLDYRYHIRHSPPLGQYAIIRSRASKNDILENKQKLDL